MTRNDLVAELHIRAGCISKIEARECVSVIADAIAAQMAAGGSINIEGFGATGLHGFVLCPELRAGMKAKGAKLKRAKRVWGTAQTLPRLPDAPGE